MGVLKRSAKDRIGGIATAIKEDSYGVAATAADLPRVDQAAEGARVAWRAADRAAKDAARREEAVRGRGGAEWLEARQAAMDTATAEGAAREAMATAEEARFAAVRRHEAAEAASLKALGPEVRAAIVQACKEALPAFTAAAAANATILEATAVGNEALGCAAREAVIGNMAAQGVNGQWLEAWLVYVQRETGESL